MSEMLSRFINDIIVNDEHCEGLREPDDYSPYCEVVRRYTHYIDGTYHADEYPPFWNDKSVALTKEVIDHLDSPLRYVNLDLLGDYYTMDELIDLLSVCNDDTLEDAIYKPRFMDIWLCSNYTIGEIKRFFSYYYITRQIKYKPDKYFFRNFKNINERIKPQMHERYQREIARYFVLPKYEHMKVSEIEDIRVELHVLFTYAIRTIYKYLIEGPPVLTTFFDLLIEISQCHEELPLCKSNFEYHLKEFKKFLHDTKHFGLIAYPSSIADCHNPYKIQRILEDSTILYDKDADKIRITFKDAPGFEIIRTRQEMKNLIDMCPSCI